MTRYIVKQFSYGQLVKKSIVTIPNGFHPKMTKEGCPLHSFPSGTRIYYESNGKEVAMIYVDKNGNKRVRWHRV